jgi:hypothetical protein
MSQIGDILSCATPAYAYGTLNWVVEFSYQLDAGGTQISRIIVGNNSITNNADSVATSALWASPTSTITVSPNPPGTTNPVTLACPDIVKHAAFGQ